MGNNGSMFFLGGDNKNLILNFAIWSQYHPIDFNFKLKVLLDFIFHYKERSKRSKNLNFIKN